MLPRPLVSSYPQDPLKPRKARQITDLLCHARLNTKMGLIPEFAVGRCDGVSKRTGRSLGCPGRQPWFSGVAKPGTRARTGLRPVGGWSSTIRGCV